VVSISPVMVVSISPVMVVSISPVMVVSRSLGGGESERLTTGRQATR
jgi:hypothetical protein